MPDQHPIEALVLDVDGTLYRAEPVRRRMALSLAASGLTRPVHTARVIRVIRAFRGNLERLRVPQDRDAPARQLEMTIADTQLTKTAVQEIIHEWMFERPLATIGGCPRKGLHRFLTQAVQRGLRLAAFSDYPCREKLKSLGVLEPFSVVLSSFDEAVRRFKPDPAGLLRAAEMLKTPAERTLVIGDRADADGAAAQAAGMRFLQIGGTDHPDFNTIERALFGRGD